MQLTIKCFLFCRKVICLLLGICTFSVICAARIVYHLEYNFLNIHQLVKYKINYLIFLLPQFYNFPLKTILLSLFMQVIRSQSGGQWGNLSPLCIQSSRWPFSIRQVVHQKQHLFYPEQITSQYGQCAMAGRPPFISRKQQIIQDQNQSHSRKKRK